MSEREQAKPGVGAVAEDAVGEHESDPRRALMQRRWIQRKAAGRSAKPTAIPTSGGEALDAGSAARLGPHVGDVAGVRVHTGGESAGAAKDLQARAFTVGKDIHFGEGEWKPGSKEGDRLLAHELSHVAEGASGPVHRKAEEGAAPKDGAAKDGAADVSQPEDPAEKNADAKADGAVAEAHEKPPTPEDKELNQLTSGECAREDGGIDTEKLIAWQTKHGIAPTGKVDPATLEAARQDKKQKKQKAKADGPKDGAKDDKVGGIGGGEALNPKAREQGEKSLGADLSGVKVHKGDEAAAAADDMGAKAFTHGQDIVLGEGEENDLNPVMAHEMAHTAQQKGGAPGVAQKSKRVAQGSSHELDADQAGAAILAGRPAKIGQHGAEEIACFEGGEHMQLGSEGFAAAGEGGPLSVGKVKCEPGLFTALQGDFYGGNWNDLEADCNDKPEGVYKLLDVLKREQGQRAAHYADPAHNAEPDSDGAIIIASMGMRAKYLEYASDNATHFGEKSADSEKKFESLEAGNPEYAAEIGFAQGNFGANVAEYLRLHVDALKRAFTDAVGGKGSDVAMAQDAGANHFLTDAFASGHMRTPRDEMMKEYHSVFQGKGRAKVDAMVNEHIPETVDVTAALGLGELESMLPGGMKPPPINLAPVKAQIKQHLYPVIDGLTSKIADQASNFGAKALHDADNQNGLQVHNAKGDAWKATGDHAMSKEEQNVKQAEMAVGASATHTRTIYEMSLAKKGEAEKKDGGEEKPPEMPFATMHPILDLLPMIDPSNAPQQDWHWDSASEDFKHGIVTSLKGAIQGTVESAADALKHQATVAIQSALQGVVGGMGAAGQWIMQHLERLVAWIAAKMPQIPAGELLNSLLM